MFYLAKTWPLLPRASGITTWQEFLAGTTAIIYVKNI